MPRTVRLGLAIVVIGWMAFAPANIQVFGYSSPMFPTWRMYHNYAQDSVCWVRFEHDGQPIDRYAALGYDDKWAAPITVRRVKSTAEIRGQARRICTSERLDTLIAHAECASLEGWQPAMHGVENLCQ